MEPKLKDTEYEESNKQEISNEDESPEGGCDCIETEDIVDDRKMDNWYSHVPVEGEPAK